MPKYYGLNDLREMFLSFFESKGHLRLPSFSLIPQNDASLLLINSGMAPMKTWFTGEQEPPRRRVCTCQKCIRTGDIENIGKTARHGTYFEMLGNFSFGDYFKHEAIAWCWEFLTSPDWVGLEPDRLYPSVYQDDDEAFGIWEKEIGVPAEKISRFGKADNFWEHGSGPCGPCSEVYYDRGEQWGCGKADCKVGCDCDRYIEVWNNVFSQFNNDGNNNYTELKQKNIDTGMGLERLACVCQQVASLFDVDTVMNITHKVSDITGAHYGQSAKNDVSLRIITDHIRSATFMICDGVLPSNEGRGYVLRRLLRRSARHGKLLGVNEPFLYKVCDTVIHENEGHYPELRERQTYLTRVIRQEEENFNKTLDSGLKIFKDMLSAHLSAGEKTFSGENAFKLYDTYGFPIDLTMEMAEEAGLTVDEGGFRTLMEEQRVRARKAREALGDLGWAGVEFGKDIGETQFVGYTATTAQGRILAMVVENERAEELSPGVEAILVLDQTPFYATMGGQIADKGTITLGSALFQVDNVEKNKGGKFMHTGKLVQGTLKVGDEVTCAIDVPRRQAIMRAHSATHLLDAALRRVLGDHVHQAGSLVEPDRIRFDFTHFAALTQEELQQISDLVNEAILTGYTVDTQEMPIDQARAQGAIALFGEKYGDVVRVVNMGGFSVELCGGTHLDNTAKAGLFHIRSEASVASGVRRIEATVGDLSRQAANRWESALQRLSAKLKTNPNELENKVEQTLEEVRALRREVEKLQSEKRSGESGKLLESAKTIGPVRFIAQQVPGADVAALRKLGDDLKGRGEDVVALLAAGQGDKVTFLCVCAKGAVAGGAKAGEIIKAACAVAGGSGGGKADSAMGGGKDASQIQAAFAAAEEYLGKL